MSTRSTIAIENEDGTIKKVYCHFDGYLSHNGRILAEQYNCYDKWKSLCLGNDLRGFDMSNGEAVPNFYSEPPFWWTPYANYAEYVASIDHLFHEYNYLMRKDGTMEVIEGNHKNPSKAKAKSLKRAVAGLKKSVDNNANA